MFLSKRLYINKIQHFESFCTRDSCLENSTKYVIFLPLEGLKRHVCPLFRCFFLYFAHLLVVLNFSIPTLLGRSFVAKWLVSLQKKGVTGSNPRVGKPPYGGGFSPRERPKVEWVRAWGGPCGEVTRVLWCGHKGVVVRLWGCCGEVTRVSWTIYDNLLNDGLIRMTAQFCANCYIIA